MPETKAPADPVIRPVDDFVGARDKAHPQDRKREVVRRSKAFREEMLANEQVVYYRSFPLIRVPYPTRYGLRDAFSLPTPLMHIVNRLFVIQFESPDGIRTLLFSPSDIHRNKETPFFKRMTEKVSFLGSVGERLLAPVHGTVEECLETIGLPPEQVDYISYDHLHTQDIRRWLGTGPEDPGYFPNAQLLVMRQEWDSAKGLLPSQAEWYCPHGTEGVPKDRVTFLDGDVRLGEGVAIVRTQGHTEGNQSLVCHTPEGLFVTSENGVGPDAYAPENSAIPGVAKHARETGVEVILNGNTLEGSVDQYISMIQERTIAGRSIRNPDFHNVVCSSEMESYWAFPGVKPTFSFGDMEFGTLRVEPS